MCVLRGQASVRLMWTFLERPHVKGGGGQDYQDTYNGDDSFLVCSLHAGQVRLCTAMLATTPVPVAFRRTAMVAVMACMGEGGRVMASTGQHRPTHSRGILLFLRLRPPSSQ